MVRWGYTRRGDGRYEGWSCKLHHSWIATIVSTGYNRTMRCRLMVNNLRVVVMVDLMMLQVVKMVMSGRDIPVLLLLL